jgi:hypothetical protein
MRLNLFASQSKNKKDKSRSLTLGKTLWNKNPEYEEFAVGLVALLQKYQHLFTTLTDAPLPLPSTNREA